MDRERHCHSHVIQLVFRWFPVVEVAVVEVAIVEVVIVEVAVVKFAVVKFAVVEAVVLEVVVLTILCSRKMFIILSDAISRFDWPILYLFPAFLLIADQISDGLRRTGEFFAFVPSISRRQTNHGAYPINWGTLAYSHNQKYLFM